MQREDTGRVQHREAGSRNIITHTGTDRCQRNCFVEPAKDIPPQSATGAAASVGCSQDTRARHFADEQWRFASTAGKYVRRLAMTLSLAVANILALSAPIAEMDTTIEKIRPPQEPRMLRANS